MASRPPTQGPGSWMWLSPSLHLLCPPSGTGSAPAFALGGSASSPGDPSQAGLGAELRKLDGSRGSAVSSSDAHMSQMPGGAAGSCWPNGTHLKHSPFFSSILLFWLKEKKKILKEHLESLTKETGLFAVHCPVIRSCSELSLHPCVCFSHLNQDLHLPPSPLDPGLPAEAGGDSAPPSPIFL